MGSERVKPCGSYWVKIEEAELTIRSHRLIVHGTSTDQIFAKNHGNLMLPDKIIATQSSKKVLT